MQQTRKKFKSPPKRYQPRGLAVLYEDHDILVVNKVSGLLTLSSEAAQEDTAYFRLNNYVRKGVQKSKNRVYILHRLERDTSGVLIVAKNELTRDLLLKSWSKCKKKFRTVVHGILPEKEGVLTSYLAENSIHKMYSVDDYKKGKIAKTGYKVLQESTAFSMLELDLMTDRKHQARVQFADLGCPVAGDKMYGPKDKDKSIKKLAYHAESITLHHPHTQEEMIFEAKVPGFFYSLMSNKR
ncbi:MAG: RluA family pseudouridine synthase [Desulfobulbaceae bacterium]|uniref:RluA family pseudouridine synthase n=1 Tax=Candidatus Desulfatifera sulfidica TaxID=2841691 RepID=A0A8J6NA41_9BACT|nr:RluA family pseudouridine synthase [Candidatus Desulfatifera sulfidica]